VRFGRFAAALIVLALVAAPAVGQVTPEDIAEAEAELASLRSETEQLAVQYEAALARSAELETQISGLESAVQESQIDLSMTRQLVRERAVEMYIESRTSQFSWLFVEDLDGGPEVALGYLSELGSSDTVLLRDLEIIKTEYERQLSELESARIEEGEVVAELAAVGSRLSARLETAQNTYVGLIAQRAAEERARAEEIARQRAEAAARAAAEEAARAAAAASTTTTVPTTTTTAGETTTTLEGATTTTVEGATTTTAADATTTTTTAPAPVAAQTCPVDGFSTFTDTWGAPRSGGRSHQGVDMLGARWTPLVAIESGTVQRMRNGGLGGITVWLRGNTGDTFYYAHMEAWADGLRVGQQVQTGDLVGYMGTSGNAPDYIPHLHFEYHPGGGAAINPYPLVKGLCG
jgi:murein DD-endopeptidase MepM/ murein hydrolase activator NlpD